MRDDSTPPREEDDEEELSLGIFPSWAWLYGTVIVHTLVLVLLLYVFTVTLDAGAR